MILLYSTTGFGALINAVFHGILIVVGLTLLGFAFYKKGKARRNYALWFALVSGLYFAILIGDIKHKKEEEKHYLGKYSLTNYENCIGCTLELYPNNDYKVYNKLKVYESGTWAYFDDGDISFVALSNGGQLGYNKYECKKN